MPKPGLLALEHLYSRLRRPPSPSSVPGSLPVLFSGDLFTAQAATFGLNPSRQEYLDQHGVALDRPGRHFQTLALARHP